MKKVFLFVMFILFSSILFSCIGEPVDTDVSLFDQHLIENQAIYQERIQVFNLLMDQEVKGVMKIVKNGTRLTGTQTGSGIIFNKVDDYYYVLTNNHVIDDPFINRTTYDVFDFEGNVYRAFLIARDPSLDLAVLRFKHIKTNLNIVTMSSENPSTGAFLSVIGYPEGQINALSIGLLLDYDVIEIENAQVSELSTISMVTSVPVQSGSSGSPVFNEMGQLVGLVYAASINQNQTLSRYMYAVPIQDIIAFLTFYELLEVAS